MPLDAANVMSPFLSQVEEKQSLSFDSGASSHLISDIYLPSNVEKQSEHLSLRTASKGSLTLNENKIFNAFHESGVKRNLHSIGQLTELGHIASARSFVSVKGNSPTVLLQEEPDPRYSLYKLSKLRLLLRDSTIATPSTRLLRSTNSRLDIALM